MVASGCRRRGTIPERQRPAAAFSPAADEEPGLGRRGRAWSPLGEDAHVADGVGPAGKPRPGRAVIDLRGRAGVMHVVAQHIDQSDADLARGAQLAGMVAMLKDRPAASQAPIEAAGHANGQALHAAGETDAVVGLDDEVDVALLDAVLAHAKARLVRGSDRRTQGGVSVKSAQAGDVGANAEGGVNRDVAGQLGAAQMEDVDILARPTGALALAAALVRPQIQR